MRCYKLGDKPGLQNLALHELDIPEPGANEVTIRVKAASLNYRDWEIINGQYHSPYQPDVIPLSDGAGEIVSVGNAVTDFAPGDGVIGSFWQGWDAGELGQAIQPKTLGDPLNGFLSEYVVLPASGIVRKPEALTFSQAATLPCAGVTAWQALVVKGQICSGQFVLIQGTGGVSLFGLQIARAHGAHAIVLSSDDTKLEQARELGAHTLINYRKTPEWAEQVRAATGGRGVDHVIEVGGPNTLAQSLAALAPGGQINVVGYLGGKEGQINPLQILQSHAVVRGIAVGPRSSLVQLCQATCAGLFQPYIHASYAWQDVAQAFTDLHSANHIGKLVLKF